MANDIEFLQELVDAGLVEKAEANRAAVASDRASATIQSTLMELGLVEEEALYRAFAKHVDLPYISLDEINHQLAGSSEMPVEFLRRSEIIPASIENNVLLIALSDLRNLESAESLGFYLGTGVSHGISSPSTIRIVLSAEAGASDEEGHTGNDRDVDRLKALANEGPIIKLVSDLVAQAVDVGASDIHIEAAEADAKVRFRVDGKLALKQKLPNEIVSHVASRLKVMANLNISEKRRPQDGRAQVSTRGRVIDIRLSTMPTQFGESIVLRLLDRRRLETSWQGLGYDQQRIEEIENAVRAPNGIFLVAGPTGSGKTTTLYTALRGIDSDNRKLVSVEDPVEYSLDGVNQVQVDPAIDMTFGRALRATLRQDPDVVFVGEIRDEETAQVATRAALVGRMVLSTIHTNDAVTAIVRLRDLRVPSYLIAATLRGVLSQRLVRKNCTSCLGVGCNACHSSGKRGRTVVSEYLAVSEDLALAISSDCAVSELLAIAESEGFVPMKRNGAQLSASGLVAADELDAVFFK